MPPPPPPQFDPELFALQEEPVEVYFVEYTPGQDLDDLTGLNLDGAQAAILHDLPEELPYDVRTQLLDSGVLDDAEIQVIDLDDALTSDYLDRNTREALEAVYASESRLAETKVDAPSKNDVNIKVRRLRDDRDVEVAELISNLGEFRTGRYAGQVKANDADAENYIPVEVDGAKLPLPDVRGRGISGILVLAPENQPPANSENPQHNLVEAASQVKPVVAEPEPRSVEPLDREWFSGDPDGWRPVWD